MDLIHNICLDLREWSMRQYVKHMKILNSYFYLFLVALALFRHLMFLLIISLLISKENLERRNDKNV